MSEWKPAAKCDVERAVAAEQDAFDASDFATLAKMLVDPTPCDILRFGKTEQVFVVAKAGQRVVYFDDVEDDFATASVVDGVLVDSASYGPLVSALRQIKSISTRI
jgi:hypothetical protein